MKHGQKTDLKESMKSSRSESGLMSNKELKQGESMSNGCKTSNMLIIFKDTKVGARGARVLVVPINSSAHPKVKLRPN
jgi:hypothetical protein